MIALLLAAFAAHAADAPKPLSPDEAKAILGCRPMVISLQGPREENFGQSQIVTEVGGEKYIRTDMGKPDGKLTVLRQGKKLCEVEISLLSGVQTVFGKVLLLRFNSGSGHHWDIYDYSSSCSRLGQVASKDASKFAEMVSSLPSCKK